MGHGEEAWIYCSCGRGVAVGVALLAGLGALGLRRIISLLGGLGLLGLLTVEGAGPGVASVTASNATTTKPTIKTGAIERTCIRGRS